MNIFKVFASGKRTLNEEFMSAVLAWFLNPRMEHGLGYQFLLAFISQLSLSEEHAKAIKNVLNLRLRSLHADDVKFDCMLECPVGPAVVDIVLRIEDGGKERKWLLGIENKIYDGSVTQGQLEREYRGLKEYAQGESIVLVYVVPVGAQGAVDEFERCVVDRDDHKALIFWQESSDGPSVAAAIKDILRTEASGEADPIPEYTRHTLKALLSSISHYFEGYDYEKDASRATPAMGTAKLVDELVNESAGFVGVQHGLSGLLGMDPQEIAKRRFQYTQQPMENRRNWIDIQRFKDIIMWKRGGALPNIAWDQRFPFPVVEQIAGAFAGRVFVGIRGGTARLEAMGWDEIAGRSFEVNSEKKSAEWIPGDVFLRIIQGKDAGR